MIQSEKNITVNWCENCGDIVYTDSSIVDENGDFWECDICGDELCNMCDSNTICTSCECKVCDNCLNPDFEEYCENCELPEEDEEDEEDEEVIED